MTLLGFNDNVFTLTRKTTDRAERIKAVDRLAPWGSTALYDVMLRGVEMLGRQTGRKALVVFTDGEDQGSHATIDDVERRLQSSDVTLYMIGQGRGVTMEPLQEASWSGWRRRPAGARCSPKASTSCTTRSRELLDELSNQYLLGYQSTNTKRDDAWRKIKVDVEGHNEVRARLGLSRAGGEVMNHNDQRRSRGTRREKRSLRLQRFLRSTSSLLAVVAISSVGIGLGRTVIAQTQPPQEPRFQTSVEVTSLDISVVDDRGQADPGLTPADFTVRVDGNPRRVVTAEWVPLAAPESDTPPPLPPDGYSTNESATGGRLIVMAIDQPNIRFGGAMAIAAGRAAIRRSARAVGSHRRRRVRHRRAGDAVHLRPRADQAGAPAHGRAEADRPLDRRRPQHRAGRGAGDRARRPPDARAGPEPRVPDRGELARRPGDVPQPGRDRSALVRLRRRPRRRVDAQTLRDLFVGLRLIDAPKTLILISEGFVLNDEALIIELGRLAAEARTSLYALKLEQRAVRDHRLGGCRSTRSPIARRESEGLELLAGAARGTLFNVTGTGQTLFERIESEISGYYLLGVESEPQGQGRARRTTVRIDVPRKGAIVRSRRHVFNTATDRPRARVAGAAAGRGGGARLAAAGIGAAAARRLVRAAGARSGTRCSC